jgi:hypothetical protein
LKKSLNLKKIKSLQLKTWVLAFSQYSRKQSFLNLDSMVDIDTLFEFSRSHCIAICAVLVPANLLATLQTMLFAGFGYSIAQVQLMVMVASFYALILLLHVFTWFAVGVVMAPTYILTCLGCVCLCINFGAILYSLRQAQRPQQRQIGSNASLT